MSVKTVARHRAARRPVTPLSAIAPVARRSALVAATSGLAVSIAAPVAMAAPDASVPQVDVSTLTAQARAALDVSPTVVVPADVEWSLEETEVKAERPVERATSSRTTSRAALGSVPAMNVSGNAILEVAFRYLGVPYVYGGSTPAGFDCSGFTQYVYAQVGISLPRSSSAQLYAGTIIPKSEARPGDLLWWEGHIGIYVGDGQYIGARRPGTPLSVSPIYDQGYTVVRVA